MQGRTAACSRTVGLRPWRNTAAIRRASRAADPRDGAGAKAPIVVIALVGSGYIYAKTSKT